MARGLNWDRRERQFNERFASCSGHCVEIGYGRALPQHGKHRWIVRAWRVATKLDISYLLGTSLLFDGLSTLHGKEKSNDDCWIDDAPGLRPVSKRQSEWRAPRGYCRAETVPCSC